MTMFMYLLDVLKSVLFSFSCIFFHYDYFPKSKLILWIPAGGAAWMSAQYIAEKHADAKRARKTPWLLYASDEGWHTAKAMILLYPGLHWNHTEMYEVDILWTDGRTDGRTDSAKVLVWLYPGLHWNHTEMYEVDILWTDGRADGRTDSAKVLVWYVLLNAIFHSKKLVVKE